MLYARMIISRSIINSVYYPRLQRYYTSHEMGQRTSSSATKLKTRDKETKSKTVANNNNNGDDAYAINKDIDIDNDHRKKRKVLVVGGGAAGLACAKELLQRKKSLDVKIFEQKSNVGGVWFVNDDRSDGDKTAMYDNLRTNLPREVMGYASLPFTNGTVDERRFCSHREVLEYLEEYAREYNLFDALQFNTTVRSCRKEVRQTKSSSSSKEEEEEFGPAWTVKYVVIENMNEKVEKMETFDAIVIANGHYSKARTAHFPGCDEFPGKQMHSSTYKEPSVFRNQNVVLVGAQASGEDISRDISREAKNVYLSAKTWQNAEWGSNPTILNNLFRKPNIKALLENGSVEFEDGSVVENVDAVMYCIGYEYDFPFLDENDANFSVHENYVSPLYEQMFVPENRSSLSFLGLMWKVVPFPQFELQAKWIAKLLSGETKLPSKDEMMKNVEDFESERKKKNIPKRHWHCLGDDQFAYNDRIAEYAGEPKMSKWRSEMYTKTGLNKRTNPEKYRDEFNDMDALQKALEEDLRFGNKNTLRRRGDAQVVHALSDDLSQAEKEIIEKQLSTISDAQMKQLKIYSQLLLEWNQKMNLTGAKTEDEILKRHVADSLSIIAAIENTCPESKDTSKAFKVIDVGTGAGFPGMVLAIARPHWDVSLLDSLQKRTKFLDHVADSANIKNVKTIWSRAEDAGNFESEHRERFDVATARAVADLRLLSELCIPFVKVGGAWIAMKNQSGLDEISKAAKAVELLGGEPMSHQEVQSLGPDGSFRLVVTSKKIKGTNKKYPRKAGTPQKSPL